MVKSKIRSLQDVSRLLRQRQSQGARGGGGVCVRRKESYTLYTLCAIFLRERAIGHHALQRFHAYLITRRHGWYDRGHRMIRPMISASRVDRQPCKVGYFRKEIARGRSRLRYTTYVVILPRCEWLPCVPGMIQKMVFQKCTLDRSKVLS